MNFEYYDELRHLLTIMMDMYAVLWAVVFTLFKEKIRRCKGD